MTNDKLNLTTTQAIGVALSGVLKNCTMSTCQDIAKDFETHLHRIGFSLVNSPECIRPESIEENHAAEHARVKKERDELAKFVVVHIGDRIGFYGDHACRECFPNSDMIVDGFLCGLHKAKKVSAENEISK